MLTDVALGEVNQLEQSHVGSESGFVLGNLLLEK